MHKSSHYDQSFNSTRKVSYHKKDISKIKYGLRVFTFAVLCVCGVGLGLGINYYQNYWNSSFSQQSNTSVLGVQEVARDSAYQKWIESELSGVFSPKNLDLDNDDLSNYEEYILGTDPTSIHTCSKQSTDMENILDLVNPVTCEPINLEDQVEFEKFNQIINVADLQQKLVTAITEESESVHKIDRNSLLNVFGVDNLSQITDISVVNLEQESERKALKAEYLKQIKKIDAYIAKHRSYEPFDRNYEVPVSGAKYLEVSLQYDIPVKYLLAIARAESRFGTDRYTFSGNLTRPGEHKNIFSMGLTDAGTNITFDTWDKGVESMGKWWQKFDQRNVSIPRRLKIFNPNGDYPGKIQGMANQIEVFLNTP